MKITVIFLAFLFNIALADEYQVSPAQELFDRTFYIIRNHYFGYKKPDFDALQNEFQAWLDEECAIERINCPYERIDSLLDSLVTSLNDPHTFRVAAPDYEPIPDETANSTLTDQEIEFLPKKIYQSNNYMNDFYGKQSISLGFSVAADEKSKTLVIEYVNHDSFAYQSGLKQGDTITSFNDQPIESFATAKIAQMELMFWATRKTPINFEFKRNDTAFSLQITPEELSPWSPQMEIIDDQIAIITVFQMKFEGLIAQVVHQLLQKAKSVNIKAIILDMRPSGGGSSIENLGILGAFIDEIGHNMHYIDKKAYFFYKEGRVFASYNGGNSPKKLVTIEDPQLWNGPLVVLTSRSTGSASEYVSYLLQQKRKAIVIGQPTFGLLNTGTTMFELFDGSILFLTTCRSADDQDNYFPEQVTPDIEVSNDPYQLSLGHDLPLERAVQELKKQIK